MSKQRTCWCSNCQKPKTREEVTVHTNSKGNVAYICKECKVKMPPPITKTKRERLRAICR